MDNLLLDLCPDQLLNALSLLLYKRPLFLELVLHSLLLMNQLLHYRSEVGLLDSKLLLQSALSVSEPCFKCVEPGRKVLVVVAGSPTLSFEGGRLLVVWVLDDALQAMGRRSRW